MIEAERQTVIDALERAASTCFTAYAHHEFMSDPKHFMHEALAIMRRDREPVAHMWQHGETGRVGFIVDGGPEDLAYWERMNKSCKIICPLYKD